MTFHQNDFLDQAVRSTGWSKKRERISKLCVPKWLKDCLESSSNQFMQLPLGIAVCLDTYDSRLFNRAFDALSFSFGSLLHPQSYLHVFRYLRQLQNVRMISLRRL